ncbi:hypothetical protein KY285_010043 [Solanum tuberosum]|nr:hypothetical protein KY285_010043 [Solanum tuberosum]
MVNDHCGVDGGNPSQALLVAVPCLFHCSKLTDAGLKLKGVFRETDEKGE